MSLDKTPIDMSFSMSQDMSWFLKTLIIIHYYMNIFFFIYTGSRRHTQVCLKTCLCVLKPCQDYSRHWLLITQDMSLCSQDLSRLLKTWIIINYDMYIFSSIYTDPEVTHIEQSTCQCNKHITKKHIKFDAIYGHFVDRQLICNARSPKGWKSGLET